MRTRQLLRLQLPTLPTVTSYKVLVKILAVALTMAMTAGCVKRRSIKLKVERIGRRLVESFGRRLTDY